MRSLPTLFYFHLSDCCRSASARFSLTPGINDSFPSTQLSLTRFFSPLVGPFPVNPRDGCDAVEIPVDQKFVKHSDQPRLAPTAVSAAFKHTLIPFLSHCHADCKLQPLVFTTST